MAITKDTTVKVSLGLVLSLLVGIPTAYITARQAIANELKEQIRQEVKPLIRPLGDALEISTQSSIRQLRTSISALNFKKDMCTGAQNCWTINDQRDLDNAIADLTAAEAVLKSLKDNK